MKIEIIVPLYNCASYIEDLNNSLKNQKDIEINNIKYILTESSDNSKEVLDSLNLKYEMIKKKEFSHSLTREKAIFESDSDYVFLLTQDVKIIDDYTLKGLLDFTVSNDLAGAYIRQVSKGKLDKYFRLYSYPKKSYVHGKKDLDESRKAVFFSDVFACINTKIFKEINGYDNKDFVTNEDMYYCYKCLKNDYKIGYYADKYVIHTHNMNYKETYNRYVLIGKFLKENKEIYSLELRNRITYVKIVFLILRRFDLIALCLLPRNSLARMRGMKKGLKED